MLKVKTVDTGTFKLDGGAMFGVVPKRLWYRLNPCDNNNMCTWAMRCLLIQTGDRTILVDTGIGNKQGEKFQSHFEPQNLEQFDRSLFDLGVSKEEITDVFLTHLHFDHVGGAVYTKDGEYYPTFPNATYWTSKTHFEWATNPNEKESASFLSENILPLMEHNVLSFIQEDEGSSFVPGVNVHFVNGHTEAMTYLKIKYQNRILVYCADLIPSSFHVGLPYIMSFDVRPLETLKEKRQLLSEAVEGNYILIFEHDPVNACATVKQDARGRIGIDQKGTLEELLAISI